MEPILELPRRRLCKPPRPRLALPTLAQPVVDTDFTSTTGSITYGSSVTNGNLLVFALLGHSWTSVPSSGMIDSLGNSWQHAIDSTLTGGSLAGVSIWYCITKSSGAKHGAVHAEWGSLRRRRHRLRIHGLPQRRIHRRHSRAR